MGYRWNRLDEPIFMAGSKPMRTEFGICQRLESCALHKGCNVQFANCSSLEMSIKMYFAATVQVLHIDSGQFRVN